MTRKIVSLLALATLFTAGSGVAYLAHSQQQKSGVIRVSIDTGVVGSGARRAAGG